MKLLPYVKKMFHIHQGKQKGGLKNQRLKTTLNVFLKLKIVFPVDLDLIF